MQKGLEIPRGPQTTSWCPVQCMQWKQGVTSFRLFVFPLVCNSQTGFSFGTSPQSSGHSHQEPGHAYSGVSTYLTPPVSHGLGTYILQGLGLKWRSRGNSKKESLQWRLWWWKKVSFWEKTQKLRAEEVLILGKPRGETTLWREPEVAANDFGMLWSRSHVWAAICWFNLEQVSVCQACGDNRPNFDPCHSKVGISLLMESELKHFLDRAVEPRYKRDATLHYVASRAFSVMALVHPTAATQHLEGHSILWGLISQPHRLGNLTRSVK